MANYIQEARKIAVATPLGEDVLLLQGFTGRDGLSRLFHYDLRMYSENRVIPFDKIVGRQATIKLVLADNKTERYVNGFINSFSQGGSSTTFAYYQATLVPWVWMLTRTTNCRIFQNMTAPDIIQKILDEHIKRITQTKYARYDPRFYGKFRTREYCVQYRETDFNFISRLMEEEGIYYFFEHDKEFHSLVLANHHNEFKPCKHQKEIRYELSGGERRTDEVVTEWSINHQVQPGRYEINDYNFEQPTLDLTTSVTGKDERKFEIYDYPGIYTNKDEGERIVGVRMEEEDSARIVISGASTSRGLTVGGRFKLKDHYRRDLIGEYVVTELFHSADLGSSYRSSELGAADSFDYRNHFQCIPYPTPYRPPRITPVPVVRGSQTAIVVGPQGEEIFTDKYGRVKVQFHWDREGKNNENSSCWIRVAQNWAGKRWGAAFIPRIGMEVIVDFLEGDPDRPIITGVVYNGNNMPPYELPADKTKTTIKTYSSKGGGGFNELRFEDKKGEEQIFIHAEKDKHIRIKEELREKVGHSSHHTIGGNQHVSVGGDKHLKVKGDHNEEVEGSLSTNVGGYIDIKSGVAIYEKGEVEINLNAGSTICIEAPTISLSASSSFITLSSAGIFISGPLVYINSGGAAIPAVAASPDAAKGPLQPVTAEPGQLPESGVTKRARQVSTYSPCAIAMKNAAKDGVPFTGTKP